MEERCAPDRRELDQGGRESGSASPLRETLLPWPAEGTRGLMALVTHVEQVVHVVECWWFELSIPVVHLRGIAKATKQSMPACEHGTLASTA